MQEKIEQHLGISPVEEEVVVLYEDDNRSNNEFFEVEYLKYFTLLC